VPLFRRVVDVMFKINTQGYSIEAAKSAARARVGVWENVRLPESKVLIPGVVTHKSYMVEYPDRSGPPTA
jgi:5-methyltetrahydropteroyltriglutamate--homocysteine methyltransferase